MLITIAALGFALLTVLLGVRAGTRIAETGHRGLGVLTTLAVFGALSFLVTFSALDPAARPSLWQGTLLPTLVFVLGILLGVLRAEREAGTSPARRACAGGSRTRTRAPRPWSSPRCGPARRRSRSR